MHPGYVVEAATAADRAAAQSLAEQAFGPGHGLDVAPDERLLVARAEGRVVGFADGTPLGDLAAGFPDHAALLRSRLGGAAKGLGLVRSIAVARPWRGRGVARSLLHALVERLRADGCNCLLARAWVHPDGRVPASALLQRAGFTALLRVPEFWRAAQGRDGFGCSACDPNPCRCAAVIYAAGC